jgi:uncharacterized small protein (DUF1192 family)
MKTFFENDDVKPTDIASIIEELTKRIVALEAEVYRLKNPEVYKLTPPNGYAVFDR